MPTICLLKLYVIGRNISYDIESLEHLLWECVKIYDFLEQFEQLKNEFNIHQVNLELNKEEVLRGKSLKSKRNDIVKVQNFIFHFILF